MEIRRLLKTNICNGREIFCSGEDEITNQDCRLGVRRKSLDYDSAGLPAITHSQSTKRSFMNYKSIFPINKMLNMF